VRSPARAAGPDSQPLHRPALRVAMLLHKSVAHDTRVRREAGALAAAGHEVTVVHLPPHGEPEPPGLPFRLAPATLRHGRERLPRPLRLGTEATRLAARAAAVRPNVVHAHDAAMLLPGLLAARLGGARLVYDSHELATGVPYRGGAWPALVAAVERLGVPRADAVIAVSDGIAARIQQRYSLSRRPAVVRNVPDLPPPGAVPAVDLRDRMGIGDAPLVVHQGAVSAERGCEALLRALGLVPDAHLLFLGAEGEYGGRLAGLAARCGVAERTHVVPPVAPEALLSHTAQADVGVSLLDDCCENHRLALPNKLFEYLAAGLPVVVSDLPEAGSLVRERGVGFPADAADPGSVAAALREALSRRSDPDLRQRIELAASELRWANEKQRLIAVYEELGEIRRAKG
jgi:glycosyltransferase involved in cell wall biosynthesis